MNILNAKSALAAQPAQKVLTVIVTDSRNERAQGAEVQLSPSGLSGVTNEKGEVELKLGSAAKYDVTVKLDGSQVTVPYYVTNGGATRLLVNPTYVQKVEAANAKVIPSWFRTDQGVIVGAIAVLILGFLLWKFLRRNK